MVQSVLFEDIFDVRVLNENGKKFERGLTMVLNGLMTSPDSWNLILLDTISLIAQ